MNIVTAMSLSRRFTLLLPALGLLFATSCTLRETRQEGSPNVLPEVKLRAVEQADVHLPKRNQLIEGYVNKSLPLKMRVQLNAYNPNLEPTALSGLDYTVLVDNKVLGSGRMPLTLELPPRDSVRVPLEFEMNTYKLLGNDALPALRNFALGFGDLNRKRMTLSLRPIVRNGRGRLSTLIRRLPLPVASVKAKPAATRPRTLPASADADLRAKPGKQTL